jgi:hypothetical protein
MQDLIEEAIRGVGHVALRLGTLGRYRGGDASGYLVEGAVGFGLVLPVMYFACELVAQGHSCDAVPR